MSVVSNAFAGDFQWWSRYLAEWSLQQLVLTRSSAPFIADFWDVPCLLVPDITVKLIRMTAFYQPKKALSIARAHSTHVCELTEDWAKYSRAFVSFRLDPEHIPHLVPVDFNATRNARNEIQAGGSHWCPDLAALDERLYTNLSYYAVDPFEWAENSLRAGSAFECDQAAY